MLNKLLKRRESADGISKLRRSTYFQVADWVLTTGVAVAALVLLVIGVYTLVPIRTARFDVPIAVTKPVYQPGEEVYGIFFGEQFYTGPIKVLREVFCKDYREFIDDEDGDDDNYFDGQSFPREINGDTLRIGNLPTDVPRGNNCTIAFTTFYEKDIPFGTKKATNTYYTQQFTIAKASDTENKPSESGTSPSELPTYGRDTQPETGSRTAQETSQGATRLPAGPERAQPQPPTENPQKQPGVFESIYNGVNGTVDSTIKLLP